MFIALIDLTFRKQKKKELTDSDKWCNSVLSDMI